MTPVQPLYRRWGTPAMMLFLAVTIPDFSNGMPSALGWAIYGVVAFLTFHAWYMAIWPPRPKTTKPLGI